MTQMLATVVNEGQDVGDLHLPHVELAYNNSVSAATDVAHNEIHMRRLPRLPLMVVEFEGVTGHRRLARDHLAYATWLQIDSSARTILFADTMPSPFIPLNAASPTHCALSLNSPWVVGHEFTTHRPPSPGRER